jgi:hypothetical protein
MGRQVRQSNLFERSHNLIRDCGRIFNRRNRPAQRLTADKRAEFCTQRGASSLFGIRQPRFALICDLLNRLNANCYIGRHINVRLMPDEAYMQSPTALRNVPIERMANRLRFEPMHSYARSQLLQDRVLCALAFPLLQSG